MKKTTSLMCQFWVPASVVWYFWCLLLFYYDSLNSCCLLSLAAIIPIKSYYNAEDDKDQILSENQNKAGIYILKNTINGKQYIGSAIDLSNRLSSYYSTTYMEDALKRGRSHIYRALLKNGHSNFSVTILEYCEPEQCIQREDYYLCSLPHEYNILTKAGSWLGHEHSEETKKIMSDIKKGENNPMYGKNHTDESKTIMSDAKKGTNHSDETKKIMSDTRKGKPKIEGSGKPSQVIEVTDIKNNITTYYDSISEAARELNLPNHTVISNYIKNDQKKPYKGRYTFTKI